MGVAAVFSPSYSDSEIIEIINQIAQAWGWLASPWELDSMKLYIFSSEYIDNFLVEISIWIQ
jgi:hypothetical protein